jgi:ankyrin repeat protein
VKNPRGELHYAARNNNMEVCKLIIGQIADKNPINNLGVTPLHYAAENDSLEICQLIIEGLEETNPSDNDGNTPLHCAVPFEARLLFRT